MPKTLIEGISGASKLCYLDPVDILKGESPDSPEEEFPCEEVLRDLLEEVDQFRQRIRNILKKH